MFEFLRTKLGPAAVGIIIGFIAFVFIFFGVFTPKGGAGRGGTHAAMVNGEPISMQEFGQSYEQRMRFYESMMKGKADPTLLRQLGLRKAVLDDLVRQKLLIQEAKKMGFVVADTEIATKIQAVPYFQKEGRFDKETYENILRANQHIPARFEDMIRQDLLAQRVSEFMRKRVRVSDQELQQEFISAGDQRQVDYVLLAQEDAKKRISIAAADIDQFLKDPGNLNAAKSFYEQTKFRYMKKPPAAPVKKLAAKKANATKPETPPTDPKPEFKTFEEVQRDVATDLLRDRKSEEARKDNKVLAQMIVSKVQAGAKDLSGFLKSKGLQVKTTQKFSSTPNYLQGVGEVADLKQEAFKTPSPLVQEPKVYNVQDNVLVAWNLKEFKAEAGEFSKEKDKLLASVGFRKERQFYESWMQDVQARAKVEYNDAVLKDPEDDNRPAPAAAARPEEF